MKMAGNHYCDFPAFFSSHRSWFLFLCLLFSSIHSSHEPSAFRWTPLISLCLSVSLSLDGSESDGRRVRSCGLVRLRERMELEFEESDLLDVCAGLGGLDQESGKYVRQADCFECLQDLQRFFRRQNPETKGARSLFFQQSLLSLIL